MQFPERGAGAGVVWSVIPAAPGQLRFGRGPQKLPALAVSCELCPVSRAFPRCSEHLSWLSGLWVATVFSYLGAQLQTGERWALRKWMVGASAKRSQAGPRARPSLLAIASSSL